MTIENYEQQSRDSDMIFTQISSGCFESYKQAEEAILMLYIPDMTISRSGISHAMKRLEKHFKS